MTVQPVPASQLAPEEKRALVRGTVYRIVGTPVVAALGLVNTAVIVRETGEAVFGLVSLVATVTLLFPFADLGIGAVVLNASASLLGAGRDAHEVDVIRRAYRVLFVVAAALVLVALAVMAVDGWGSLIGFSSGPDDRWAITVAVVLFALTIPAGLGVRILIGIDRNQLATLVLMSSAAFSLMLTLLLYACGVDGIWYALSALGGVLAGHLIGTAAALRLSGLGWSAFAPVSDSSAHTRLLEGSLWLFLVGVGLPVGLQTGRILLSHLSTPAELSEYALMAQMYGVGWSVLSTAGMAYWPVFVKRRGAAETTVRIWWRLTAAFTAFATIAAVGMTTLAPWVASILSGGRIEVSAALALAFGVLLVAQSMHLPASVLLTRPNEARWQACWIAAMATASLGVGVVVAGPFGAVGVVCAAALGVLAAQVLPDLLWVPTLVRRRPRAPASQ
ncbi:lipopolysaccharide biosynthesis protein [Rhodococcus tukisamuensis]|uniref:Membrane protein involved in the export of O-antigen and teichoic acid n=1 Tax=Rhodococcus tukisamuensis TaxID=168276 RepID=A0A1G7AL68_9NOCA|nr:oligosaccharide flippase family protein [Rhodococcus tukisamuensis]SDE15532.1 Membrane protein involved in the export of O-antigen and teichoic acid [Rhodococcus tukisamuensis]